MLPLETLGKGASMSTARTPDLLRGTLDMMILNTLAGEPDHGYGIARRIRERSDDVLVVEEGSLYPALHRLQKRGFVESEWKQSEKNRRARYYTLTRSGRAQLNADARTWTTLAQAIGKVMDAKPTTKPTSNPAIGRQPELA